MQRKIVTFAPQPSRLLPQMHQRNSVHHAMDYRKLDQFPTSTIKKCNTEAPKSVIKSNECYKPRNVVMNQRTTPLVDEPTVEIPMADHTRIPIA